MDICRVGKMPECFDGTTIRPGYHQRLPDGCNPKRCSCSARQKSKPRNGAGEIFMTAAAEIARETVSTTNRFGTRDG